MARNIYKLYFWFDNDIKSYYAEEVSSDPLVIYMPNFNENLLDYTSKVNMTNLGDTLKKIYKLDLLINSNSMYQCDNMVEDDVDAWQKDLSIDYKDTADIAIVNDLNVVNYVNVVDSINRYEGESLTATLKQVIYEDIEQNSMILNYITEMNRKLDEVLSIIRAPTVIEGSFKVRSISISSEWFIFFSEQEIMDGSVILMHMSIYNDGDKLVFASLCRVNIIKGSSDKGYIYIANYKDISESIKDRVIKFIFSKDRENLKQLK